MIGPWGGEGITFHPSPSQMPGGCVHERVHVFYFVVVVFFFVLTPIPLLSQELSSLPIFFGVKGTKPG